LAGDPPPLIVEVDEVSADGQSVASMKALHLSRSTRRVTFNFTGLSLSIPSRVEYRYRLDGFDRSWSQPAAAREAAYTNLGPGSYRFRVVASNVHGLWNSPETTVEFQVDPAFWQTSWFQAAAVLGVGLTCAAGYRLRLRRLTNQLNLRFEERLAERTRIAQELHDTLLQGFLSASMQLHVAVDGLVDGSPGKPAFDRVLQLMTRVIDEGRNAVRGLRASPAGPADLEQALSGIRQEVATTIEAGFRVIVEGKPRSLHPVIRDEVYRIGREALINAFRHSSAQNIELELEYAAAQLRLLVRDDGRGIDPDVLRAGREGHWGLPGMRERAERIGARFHVWSSSTAGTEVELSVPSQIAFRLPPEGRLAAWMARRHQRKGAIR